MAAELLLHPTGDPGAIQESVISHPLIFLLPKPQLSVSSVCFLSKLANLRLVLETLKLAIYIRSKGGLVHQSLELHRH